MTRKTRPTATQRRHASDAQIALSMRRDAALVLFEEFCRRRLQRPYTAADRRLDGAEEYGRRHAAALKAHGMSDELMRLDEAHGNALARVQELAFVAGLHVGLGLTGGGVR